MNALEERRRKAYSALQEAGIDRALLGDPMSINYFTGVHVTPYERFYGLILDSEAGTCTMVNPGVDANCMRGRVREIMYDDADGPKESIRKAVGKCKKLAVETKYYSMSVGKMLHEVTEDIVDIGTIVAKLRMFKDADEIKTMQRAADIVDDALVYVSDKIKPGMTEKQLNLMLYTYMANIPGVVTDEFIILVLAADNSANPHGVSGDYAFKDGDIILIDFCAYYDHYWSDITRCFFLGHIGNPKLEEIYNIAKGANLAGIAAVRPGVTAKSVDAAARKYITDAGYGKYFLHRTGHGLGLSVHEEPYITAVNDIVLEEGMTFTIEPGIYLEGIGGVRVEDDILVTRDGCRVLTKTSKNLHDHIIKI